MLPEVTDTFLPMMEQPGLSDVDSAMPTLQLVHLLHCNDYTII